MSNKQHPKSRRLKRWKSVALCVFVFLCVEQVAVHKYYAHELALNELEKGRVVREEVLAFYHRVPTDSSFYKQPHHILALSHLLIQHECREEAEAVLRHGLEANPNSIPLLSECGLLCFRENDYVAARGMFGQIAEIDPHNERNRIMLAWCCFALHDVEEGNRLLGTASEPCACGRSIVQDVAKVHGTCKSGQAQKALKFLGEASYESSDLSWILNAVVGLLCCEGHYDNAIDVVVLHLKHRPYDKDLRRTLAQLYERAGRKEDSKAEYEVLKQFEELSGKTS